jgi:hypothetical protein
MSALSNSNHVLDEMWNFPIKNMIREIKSSTADLKGEKNFKSGADWLPGVSLRLPASPYLLLPAYFTRLGRVI